MSKAILIEMFENMVRRKDSSLVSRYYDPEFILTTNGRSQNYQDFLEGHRRVYSTSIAYDVRYDESTWTEDGERLAVRCWIRVMSEGTPATELEVMLISKWRSGRIFRLWELTWPDWSALQALENYDV